MIIKIAEYKINDGELKIVLGAIEEFLAAIEVNEPNTFYEAFQKGETLEFIHLMKFSDSAAEERHRKATYTEKFVKALYPRCEIQPKFTDVSEIK